MENKNLGAQDVKWDLSFLYKGVDDPQIDEDVKSLELLAKKFVENYKGKLYNKLGEAIEDYSSIKMLSDKIGMYLFLQQSLDVTNAAVKSKVAEVEQKINSVSGQYLTFFTIELVALSEEAVKILCDKDEIVKKHKPWIDHQRVFKPHLLTEEVESALTKRSAFGLSAWSQFFDECEADLEFNFEGSKKTLLEMLDSMSHLKDASQRAEALRLINQGFSGYFSKYSAQTLSILTGEMAVEIKERNYSHPMQGQNKSNNIPDEVVDALHIAVMESAGSLAKRYYKLKAKLLGLKKLAWSDRNAPLPFADTTAVPFGDAMELVQKAYESFSPTLARIVHNFFSNKKVDAPATKGKRGGAFNCSFVLENDRTESLTLLNYLGSGRDVMTLAHELGHGVHGILAGQAQSPLMCHAPIAYCETASVFGEMTTFNFLKKQLLAKNDTNGLLVLLTGKIEDMLNTVVRQISFSNFERRIHGMDAGYKNWGEAKKLSVKELSGIWGQVTKELYGNDGEVFTYENTEYLWSYISHFHRPFYVYGYAFGELLTQSLYAVQEKFGKNFEPLYLELLRSGSTKNATELLAPFGLDPVNPQFWADGIKVGLEAMIVEAETISRSLKKL